MTRLPRTIRLDASDLSVFHHAAEPGEWAVPGSFAFLNEEGGDITGKHRAAFAVGFLGLGSFGWSTLVMVTSAPPEAMEQAVTALAGHLAAEHGAPNAEEARRVARREVAFASSLCDHPPGTLLAVSRRFDGDALNEQFKTIVPHEADQLDYGLPLNLRALAGATR